MTTLSTLTLGTAKAAIAPFAPYLIAAALAAAAGGLAWGIHYERDIGRAEIQLKWDAAVSQQRAAALAEEQSNAKESFRRIAAQQENQRVQDIQLAAAQRDAALNRAAAGKLRVERDVAAGKWRDALNNSPTVENCQAAGAAIVVQADVLGRADGVAGDLAEAFDTARAHGLKCEADYETLNIRAAAPP